MKLLLILLIIYIYLKYSQKEDFTNNKTIWMYWEQGEENLKIEYNKKCIKQWRHLHPTWNVRVLNYDQALELIPDLKKNKSFEGSTQIGLFTFVTFRKIWRCVG